MDLHRLHILTPKICSKEGFCRCVAIDEDGIVADRTGQDVGDRTEDGERILSEEEGRAVRVRSARALIYLVRATYGLGLLSTPLWFCKLTSMARTSLSPAVGFCTIQMHMSS